MTQLIVLGSSAQYPLPRIEGGVFNNYLDIERYEKQYPLHDDLICTLAKQGGKNQRTRAALAIIVKKGVIVIDAGPDILYQLAREKLWPDVILLTHNHLDASYGVRYLPEVTLLTDEKGNVPHDKTIEILGVPITPFRTIHSTTTPSTGYLIELNGKRVVYVGDTGSLKGVRRYTHKADVVFADGSILPRSMPSHLSIIEQIKQFKRWDIKRLIFTHIGHDTLPHEELSRYVKSLYPFAEVAYDGMVVEL